MKFNQENIIAALLGICVPVVGYAIVMIIFEQLANAGIMSELSSGGGVIKRMRTMAVLGIAFNLIPFNYYKIKKKFQGMKLVVFATFIYAIVWIIYFWDSIMI